MLFFLFLATGSALADAVDEGAEESEPDNQVDPDQAEGSSGSEPTGDSGDNPDQGPSGQNVEDESQKDRRYDDKYYNPDGSLKSPEELAEMHSNLEDKLGEKNPEFEEMQQELAELRGMVEASNTSAQKDGEPSQNGDGPDPESDGDLVDEIADKIVEEDGADPLDDPKEFTKRVLSEMQDITGDRVEQLVQEHLEPVQQYIEEQRSDDFLSEYSEQRPEFEQYEEQMDEIVENYTVGGEKPFKRQLQKAESQEEVFEILDTVLARAKEQSDEEPSSTNSNSDGSSGSTNESKATSTNGTGTQNRGNPQSDELDEKKEQAESTIEETLGSNF